MEKINHKPDLIFIFKNLPFNKDVEKLKKLLSWLQYEFDINVLDIGRIRNYDLSISEILNAIYRNSFEKMKDDFIAELKRRIRIINLNESMKKSELTQIIKECIMELSKSSFLHQRPIPKVSIPTDKELYNWIKNIDDENLLSWCGYSSKKDFEDGCDCEYSKKNLLDFNYDDLVYVYQHKDVYGMEN